MTATRSSTSLKLRKLKLTKLTQSGSKRVNRVNLSLA